MTSTPESAPEPRWVCALGNPFCSAVTAKPRLNGDNRHAECWRNNTRPAASSPDEGGEWVCVAGSPLTCNETSQHDAPGHERCGPASADEGAPEGCEIDPVSSRGCERGTPGCVTQHADEGTRQRPHGTAFDHVHGFVKWDAAGKVETCRICGRNRQHVADAWAEFAAERQPDAAPPAPSTPAHPDEGTERPDTAALREIADRFLLDEDGGILLREACDWIDAQPPVPPTPAPQADEQIRSDAAWIARLARGSSWPGEMAQRVEDACDRVTLWAAATPPSTPAERPQPGPAPTDGEP